MPKVIYTKAKGLYQEAGNGQETSHAIVANLSNAVSLTTATTLSAATHAMHPILVTGTNKGVGLEITRLLSLVVIE